MQKAALVKTVKYLLFILIFGAVLITLFYFSQKDRQKASEPTGTEGTPTFTVVLDAGHGGEDGGAESTAGVFEKDLNLDIALRLRDLLEAAGIRVIMTRTEDILLYDRNVDFKGRKKVLDLAARLAVGESSKPDLFVSIHMNAFPDSRYAGLQVWYSPNDPRSMLHAESVQNAVKKLLQPENNRKIKAGGSNIFLLDRLTVPAILVECGFLSNPGEAQKLSEMEYREELSLVLCGAILSSLENQSVTP